MVSLVSESSYALHLVITSIDIKRGLYLVVSKQFKHRKVIKLLKRKSNSKCQANVAYILTNEWLKQPKKW